MNWVKFTIGEKYIQRAPADIIIYLHIYEDTIYKGCYR